MSSDIQDCITWRQMNLRQPRRWSEGNLNTAFDTLGTCAQDRPGDRTMIRGCRFHRVLGAVLFLEIVFGPFPVSGYRFMFNNQWSESTPVAWMEDVWAPGETLSFVLVEDPDWMNSFSTLAEAEAFIEDEAMDVWSGISSADVQWDIEGTATERLRGRSGIFVGDWGGRLAAAHISAREGLDGRYRVAKCEIRITPRLLAAPREALRGTLVHELGHCLGLAHAGVFSTRNTNRYQVERPSAWHADPIMSYGQQGLEVQTADDRIGASLLRPASGWEAGTGSIRGNVLVKDEGGASFVHIVAARLDADGGMVESVGSFTNIHGEFLIEGLLPGDYSLLARSITLASAHPGRTSYAEKNIRDALQTSPVTVRAGRISGPVAITVRRGAYRW